MTNLIRLNILRINDHYAQQVAYVNKNDISSIIRIDNNSSQIRMSNSDVMTVTMPIDKLRETLEND